MALQRRGSFAWVSASLSAITLAAVSAQSLVAQETSGGATLTSGVSYSSNRGGLAFIGLEAANLFNTGTKVKLRFEKGEDGEAALASVGKIFELGDTRLGRNTYVIGSLEGGSEDWASDEFASASTSADLRVGAEIGQNLSYQARLFWRQDDLKRFAASVSPLVLAEPRKSTAAGIGFGLDWSSLDQSVLPNSGSRYSLDVAWATGAGDREWVSLAASASTARPLGERAVLSFSAEGGHIAGLNGDSVSIVDRAFVGNPMPRGFAAGGLGPRDFVAGPGGTDTALGGNSYLTMSVETRFRTANPNLQIGAFVDAGAVWDLDTTTGAASGTIDDSF